MSATTALSATTAVAAMTGMSAATLSTAVTDTAAFLLELGTYLAVGHLGHRLAVRGRHGIGTRTGTQADVRAGARPGGRSGGRSGTRTGARPGRAGGAAAVPQAGGGVTGLLGWAGGLALVAVFAAIWWLFGAPGATVPLRGVGRAVLEVLWFGGGTAALALTGKRRTAVAFGTLYLLGALLRAL